MAGADVEIRPAGPDDVGAMAAFWHRHMNRRLPPERWRRICSDPWLGDAPNRGWLATAGGELVGALGLIYSTRRLRGRVERMCNLSSIYVRKDHRRGRVALEMLARATADPTFTYYVFNAQPGSRAAIEQPEVAFGVLDDERYVWRRDDGATAPLELLHRSARIRERLGDESRRIYDDHVPLGVDALWASIGGEAVFALLWARNKTTDVVHHEVLYVDRPELLCAGGRLIAGRILGRGEVLCADSRYFARPPPGAEKAQIPLPRYCKSARVPRASIDLLYSEVPLLDLKLS